MSIKFDSLSLESPFYYEPHHQWRMQLRRFVENEITPYIDAWEEQGTLKAQDILGCKSTGRLF